MWILYLLVVMITSIIMYCLNLKYKDGYAPWDESFEKPNNLFNYISFLVISLLFGWFIVPATLIIFPLYKLADFCSKKFVSSNEKD